MSPPGRARRLAGRIRPRLFPSPEMRAWRRAVARAEGEPRYRPGTIVMDGLKLRYSDLTTFCPQWHDLFVRQTLRFAAATPAPRILDGGANVGLASLYWKRLYPAARITAFEPHPALALMLRQNLAANQAGDVQVIQAALWTAEGRVSLRAEGADASALAAVAGEGLAGAPEVEVPAVRLKDLLAGEAVDLLKLDIEGAEEAVLADAAPALANVRCLVVEIHESDPARRRAPGLLDLLAAAGFRYSLGELFPLDRPAGSPPLAGPFPDAAPCWVLQVRAWRD